MSDTWTPVRRNARVWAALCLFFAVALGQAGVASAQVRSDLEIKRSFERQVADIRAAITTIMTTTDADSLLGLVDSIDQEFAQDEAFLNSVLEPQSFNSVLGELRNLIAIQRSQLRTIDTQREEIVVLNQRISTITIELQRSTLQTDSLRRIISRTNASREVMSNLVRDYRSRLDERDQLIRLFIDSLIVTFDDPKMRELMVSEQRIQVNRLNKDDDALKLIQAIVDDNISIISGTTEFDTPFYLRMNTLQNRMDETWSKLGLTISTVYAGRDQAVKTNESVAARITSWRQRLHGALWNSMYRTFSENGILLDDFESRDGFVSSVNAYLDTTLTRLQAGVNESDYRGYENFKLFWSTEVKANWAPMMLESKLLSMDDINQIDQKVEDWGTISRPRSDNLYLYLGISFVIILALLIMLIMAKRTANRARMDSSGGIPSTSEA